jgi:hypothetical protein
MIRYWCSGNFVIDCPKFSPDMGLNILIKDWTPGDRPLAICLLFVCHDQDFQAMLNWEQRPNYTEMQTFRIRIGSALPREISVKVGTK